MDKNIYKAKWKQKWGKTKMWRGRISRRRMDRISGMLDVIVGKVQEKYSMARYKAARGIDRRRVDQKPRLLHRRPGSKSQ